MIKRRQFKQIICLLLIPLVLAGCWDRREIEDRGFVMAMGVDLSTDTAAQKKEHKEVRAAQKDEKRTRYAVTYQMAIPAKMAQSGGGSTGGSGGGGQSSASSQAFMNITSEGDTLFETVRILETRSSRKPYFEHDKLFIVGENIARSGQLSDVMDLMLRDHEMRRRMKVIIVKGTAKEALGVKPKQERLPTEYYESLSENYRSTARMPGELTIGNLQEKLLAHQSFAVQRVVPKQTEAKMAGSAVFHGTDNRLIGWLGEEETEGLMWLTGRLKGGIVETALPSGELIVYEIHKARTKVQPIVDKGKFIFKVNIETEGSLAESHLKRADLTKDFHQQVESAVERDIKQLTADVVEKLQTEFHADVIGMGRELARKQPQVWKTVKQDWEQGENEFSRAAIIVEPHVKLLYPGVISSLTD